jgi:hypothetical protein
MTIPLMSLMIVLSLVPLQIPAAPTVAPLDGCLAESRLADAVAKLAQEDWKTVSLAELRTIWPTDLSDTICQFNVCHMAWSMDRIISGHAECCTTFAFDMQESGGSNGTERLNDVAITYTSSQRDQLVFVAKNIARAAGVNEKDLASIGSAKDQHFSWIKTRNNQQELSSIELQIGQHGQHWELFVNWGRNIVEPIQGKSSSVGSK